MEPVNHNWTCEDIEAQLADYLDGTLAADARAAFEAHAAGCRTCAPMVESVRGVVQTLRRVETLEEPPQIVYAILDKTIGRRTEKAGWRTWFSWLRPVAHPRFAYGAVTILVTAIVLSQALGIKWRKPTASDFNPVNIYYSLNQKAHQAYARAAKFITDLRVVYEIQSVLRPAPETQPAAPAPKASPSSKPDPNAPKEMNLLRQPQRDKVDSTRAASEANEGSWE